jgi:hypothetical protein
LEKLKEDYTEKEILLSEANNQVKLLQKKESER